MPHALLKGQRAAGRGARRRSAASSPASPACPRPISSRPTCASATERFYKELLRDRGLTIGRLDARYTGRDYDNAGETPDNDPSFYGIDAGYTAALNQHGCATTLGFQHRPLTMSTIGQVGAVGLATSATAATATST